ncbi:ARMT1-like domain-containing protein [Streptacidiphilus sp. PAMC 29251]
MIQPLEADAQDHGRWARWSRPYLGLPWTDAPFLWAESYFYRRLLSATGYFTPGPMQGIDPFAPFKDAELRGPAVEEELSALDSITALDQDERTAALLSSSLWGNRADLSFQITAGQSDALGTGGLLADDRAALSAQLRTRPPGRGCLIADNSARELLPDLVLLDHLLASGLAATAVLYIKPHPYYASDATTADTFARWACCWR